MENTEIMVKSYLFVNSQGHSTPKVIELEVVRAIKSEKSVFDVCHE